MIFDFFSDPYDYAGESRRLQKELRESRKNMKTSNVWTNLDLAFDLFDNLNATVNPLSNTNTNSKVEPGKITISVPGLSREDLKIEVDGLSVSVETNKKDALTKPFLKTWKFNEDSDMDSLNAECKNGVLTITWQAIHKQEKQKKTIEIK